MKVKGSKSKEKVPCDPVLFAATVPSRKPTAKDVADTKKHQDDLIEPKEYTDTNAMLDEP